MNNTPNKILTVITIALLSGSPVIGAYVFSITKNPLEAFFIGFFVFFGGIILSFFTQIWSELQNKWVSRITTKLDHLLQNLFSNFNEIYFSFLFFRHRDFDVKGLDTQGIYNLELNQVFVDLSIIPNNKFQTSIVPSQVSSVSINNNQLGPSQIWKYLEDQTNKQKLVIIGPPGSGKTTLLKHIVLVLTGKKKIRKKFNAPNKIPILLFLREHHKEIIKNDQKTISDLIKISLSKYKISPPPTWFENKLLKGNCIIMLDGLDEVAKTEERQKIVAWVEKQLVIYSNNDFIITSRPLGYLGNQVNGVTILEIVPFNFQQIQKFINNWYFANEIRASGKNDPGVELIATEGAQELISKLKKTPELLDLAVNPLLLTMIATVHRYRSSLPGRRIELYEEICKVFLGKRQQSRDIEIELSPSKSQAVLQELAHYMMTNRILEIQSDELENVINNILALVGYKGSGKQFAKWIEGASGLILERGVGIYGFCHKTFQEYLAANYISEKNLGLQLLEKITNSWWNETIRLFCAQNDASQIIKKCIEPETLTTQTLILATQCLQEAMIIDVNTKQQLNQILRQDIEHEDPERRKVVAEALLSLRTNKMETLEENKYFDPNPITNAEYQLFLDDYSIIKKFFQPSHWKDKSFDKNLGLLPVSGITNESIYHFCEWLSKRDISNWKYRPPTKEEVIEHMLVKDECIWVSDGKSSYTYDPSNIERDVNNNLMLNSSHYIENTIILIKKIVRYQIESERLLKRKNLDFNFQTEFIDDIPFDYLKMLPIAINKYALDDLLHNIRIEEFCSIIESNKNFIPKNLEEIKFESSEALIRHTQKLISSYTKDVTQDISNMVTSLKNEIDLLNLYFISISPEDSQNNITNKRQNTTDNISSLTRRLLENLQAPSKKLQIEESVLKKSTDILNNSEKLTDIKTLFDKAHSLREKVQHILNCFQKIEDLAKNLNYKRNLRDQAQNIGLDLAKALDLNRSLETEKIQNLLLEKNLGKGENYWAIVEINKKIVEVRLEAEDAISILETIDLFDEQVKNSIFKTNLKTYINTVRKSVLNIDSIAISTLPVAILQKKIIWHLIDDIKHHHSNSFNFSIKDLDIEKKIQYIKIFSILATIALQKVQTVTDLDKTESINLEVELFLKAFAFMVKFETYISGKVMPPDRLILIKYHL